ncbi:uncharacterized protein CEXT_327171 [Caerostris extrusa]|uniref:Uncharacterized protein n=1 Tax=Caerostris extrusa TaxID=172846 RepID=A0AAV4XSY7_CAEEX|nr:uncharacterized protein CEXT_327171 [Caerostris extrusa]
MRKSRKFSPGCGRDALYSHCAISSLATTTTTEKFSCDPPKGAEAKAECPMDSLLLNALGSKSPFFGDALSPKCYDFKENLYDASKDDVHYFFSVDKGITIKAQCPGNSTSSEEKQSAQADVRDDFPNKENSPIVFNNGNFGNTKQLGNGKE